MYKRICKGLSDIGQLVPYQEKVKTKQDKDYYESIYYYTDEQKVIAEQEVEKDGKKRIRGVSGITEVVTDKLIWDLDSEDNLEDAKNDTITLAQKLYDLGYKEEEVRICFSGKKGFSVTVYIGEFITPDQFKAITSELAEGLKTYDSVVANPSRIIRLANTKHQDSGLYKTPYTFEDLKAMSTVEIKEYASGEYEEEISKTWTKGNLVEDLRNIEVKVEEQNSHDDSKIRKGDLKVDYRFNPYNLVPWKLAIQQGIFPSGCRSNALMILAASLKAKNLHEEDCYYQLKSAVQKQARRFGADKFDKREIYNNIIGQVYGDNWTGATYSVENFPQKLKDFYEDLGIPKTREVIVDEELIESVEEGFKGFIEYANTIDENTMKFGLKSLDDKIKIRKGHLIYLLAPPGAGKCEKINTPHLMYDGSIKMVQDIKVGDKLMGPDSKPRTVLSLARGRQEMFDVIPTKGEVYGFNRDHVLSLRCSTNVNQKFRKGEIYNISINDYLELPKYVQEKLKLWRTGVEFEQQSVPYTPYTIGAWLAEGSFPTSSVRFTCGDKELKNEVEKEAALNDVIFNNVKESSTNCEGFSLTTKTHSNHMLNYLRDVTKDGEKRIPKEYKINSEKVRLELLAGLLDGDGNLHHNSFEITTKYKGLAEDIKFLCRSLGFYVNHKEKEVKLKGWEESRTYQRLNISGHVDKIPTRISRKKASPRRQVKDVLSTGFKLVSTGVDDYYGFTLDGDHLYLLEDFTVSHNTSFGITLLNNMSKQGAGCYFGSYDMYKNNVYQKLIQRHTGLPEEEIFDVFRNNDKEQIDKFGAILAKEYGNVSFCFKVGQSIADLKRSIEMEEKKRKRKIDLVVVDYLELILTDTKDPTAASAEAAQGLREIANAGRVVVGLLQPNKMNSHPNEPITSYNGAKGSSTIAQSATAILTAHRPGMDSATNNEFDHYFSINCVKNRNGSLFNVDYGWVGKTQTIYELEEIERLALADYRKAKAEQKAAEDDF